MSYELNLRKQMTEYNLENKRFLFSLIKMYIEGLCREDHPLKEKLEANILEGFGCEFTSEEIWMIDDYLDNFRKSAENLFTIYKLLKEIYIKEENTEEADKITSLEYELSYEMKKLEILLEENNIF